MYEIAVDIGGTFTDCVVIKRQTGIVYAGKAPTTPANLIEGVLNSLDNVCEQIDINRGSLLQQTERFVHATTQSTNALLTYSGARTALLTTRGFGDTIVIMRGTGRVAGLSVFERHHYRRTDRPRLLVDERDVFEVSERVDAEGEVLVPLKPDEIKRIAAELRRRGYRAVAVCLLFGYKNPAHERQIRDVLREELPEVYITLGSEVAPVLGEYERSATAVVNSYVGPVIVGYLDALTQTLREAGLNTQVQIVQANGGVTTARQTVPIYTVESGPAAGVVGAAYIAKRTGYRNVIATDVGGTTFKVALIEDGQWNYTRNTILNQYTLRFPMIDIASIGAGGGSIAWRDGPRLQIGPLSAQADPGPACYGFGGTQPTVTDADVVLGYISPAAFLGGRMTLRPDLAAEAIRREIADHLFDGDVITAAAGIRNVIDNQMADLIRKVTLERGYDPRNLGLMAYGGCGPCHAVSYAAEVGAREVMVPYLATVHSAYGAATSDVRYSEQISEPMVLPQPSQPIADIYQRLEAKTEGLLDEALIDPDRRQFLRWVEARYRRQVHVVRVPFPNGPITAVSVDEAVRRFEAQYERLYGPGSAYREAGVEFVNYGVDAIGLIDTPALSPAVPPAGNALRGTRPAYCLQQRKFVEAFVYDGTRLAPGDSIAGLAIIEHPGTTILVETGYRAYIDEFRNTRIPLGA